MEAIKSKSNEEERKIEMEEKDEGELDYDNNDVINYMKIIYEDIRNELNDNDELANDELEMFNIYKKLINEKYNKRTRSVENATYKTVRDFIKKYDLELNSENEKKLKTPKGKKI